MVIVEGGPLSVNPAAEPGAICLGDTAQLFSLAGGGSGLYTYQWSASPPGFTSAEINPRVAPDVTTTYYLMVDDGFNQRSGSSTVEVFPLPEIRLGPSDSIACIYDTITLDAGNPGSTYEWSDGSTGRYLTCSTTGLGFDMQTYSVIVQNQNGCRNEAVINITFTFDACVGINELNPGHDYTLYPNPAGTWCRISMKGEQTLQEVTVMNVPGSRVYHQSFTDHKPKSHDISLEGIAPGLYLIRIVSGKQSGVVRLIVD